MGHAHGLDGGFAVGVSHSGRAGGAGKHRRRILTPDPLAPVDRGLLWRRVVVAEIGPGADRVQIRALVFAEGLGFV
jgi:hypothetical protein